nr:hypothetical protein HK105_003145 [Polyrhizophydium stewartii]
MPEAPASRRRGRARVLLPPPPADAPDDRAASGGRASTRGRRPAAAARLAALKKARAAADAAGDADSTSSLSPTPALAPLQQPPPQPQALRAAKPRRKSAKSAAAQALLAAAVAAAHSARESQCQADRPTDGVSAPRRSLRPTIFEEFTLSDVDWCRYCGVTQQAQTAAFRPGPWGKRTLCNKHGCDYKGYGYIEKEPRLNLAGFVGEPLHQRIRPILQEWCASCFQAHSAPENILVQCDGCSRAFHEACAKTPIPRDIATGAAGGQKWYCNPSCLSDSLTGHIAIEVPKRNLPLMRAMGRAAATPGGGGRTQLAASRPRSGSAASASSSPQSATSSEATPTPASSKRRNSRQQQTKPRLGKQPPMSASSSASSSSSMASKRAREAAAAAQTLIEVASGSKLMPVDSTPLTHIAKRARIGAEQLAVRRDADPADDMDEDSPPEASAAGKVAKR